jgi:hypothetical protein
MPGERHESILIKQDNICTAQQRTKQANDTQNDFTVS